MGDKTGIIVAGGNVDREGVEAVAGAIGSIFESARENHMEQETVQEALNVFGRLATVQNVSVSGNTIEA